MKKRESNGGIFRFKRFAVAHGGGSMKVGVDGVLIGAWGCVEGKRGLDVGCGCGLIGLMAAQRNSRCNIDLIDVHQPSVDEALANLEMSDWSRRLKVVCSDVSEFARLAENKESYDFIISNPPFFQSGLKNPATPREVARHEGSLSPASLLSLSVQLLKPLGTLSMVIAAETEVPSLNMMQLERICLVADRPGKQPKRRLLLYRKTSSQKEEDNPLVEKLYIRNADGSYSAQYKELTKDFYLDF